MILGLNVNGESVQVSIRSVDRLVDVLRGRLGLSSLAADCRSGNCGRCLAFMDGRLVYTCMVPAFRAKDAQIVTLEGFAKTEKYDDIVAGFTAAGLTTCGFCLSAKILAAADLLERDPMPSPETVLHQMDAVRCRCSDPDTISAGVIAAAKVRAARLYHRVGK